MLLFLFQCHIQLDRKVLTDLAIYEPRTFKVRPASCFLNKLATCLTCVITTYTLWPL